MIHPLRLGLLAAGLTLATIPGAGAADQQFTVVLVNPDGSATDPIQVANAAISYGRQDEKGTQKGFVSGFFSTEEFALADTKVLGWIRGWTGASVLRITVADRAGTTAYELSGLTTLSVDIRQSATDNYGQNALSVAAKRVTINGVALE